MLSGLAGELLGFPDSWIYRYITICGRMQGTRPRIGDLEGIWFDIIEKVSSFEVSF